VDLSTSELVQRRYAEVQNISNVKSIYVTERKKCALPAAIFRMGQPWRMRVRERGCGDERMNNQAATLPEHGCRWKAASND
jgi:hypothetical protein